MKMAMTLAVRVAITAVSEGAYMPPGFMLTPQT